MLLPTRFRGSAQQGWGAGIRGDAQLIYIVRAALPLECRYAHQVSPAALKAMHEFRVGGEIRIVERLVIESDAVQAMGIEPTAGWFQDRKRGVERRETGKGFKS